MFRLPSFIAALALFAFGLVHARAVDRPNVLFLICDDLNCDIGCYGHPLVKTPNIDRLAARGVRFDRAYCQYPLCGPSRASFMTGLYPDQNLVKRNAIYIREHVPNVNTVSQMFRDAGYFATRIGKIYHYNVPKHIGTSGHDDPYSWNYTINPRGRDKTDEEKIFSLKPGSFGATLSWLAAEGTDQEQTDGIAATEAANMLDKFAAEGTPFFLAVGLYRPHTPYVAPKKYFEMHPLEEVVVPTLPEGYLDTLPAPARKSITRKKDQVNLKPQLARQAIQAYYASISFADAQIGRVLDALEATGLAANTIVAKGADAKSMAEMVDFYPTLAELSGLEIPESVSGVSLAEALADPSKATRTSALTEYAGGYSIRTERYRYTEWAEAGADGRELYDHASDPAEMKNLADDPERRGTIKELSQLLRARIQEAKTPPKGVKQNHFDNRRSVPQRNN